MPTSSPLESAAGKSVGMQDVPTSTTSSKTTPQDRASQQRAPSSGVHPSRSAVTDTRTDGISPKKQRHQKQNPTAVAVERCPDINSNSRILSDQVTPRLGSLSRSQSQRKAQSLVTDQQRRIRQLEKDLSQSQVEIQRLRAQTLDIEREKQLAVKALTAESFRQNRVATVGEDVVTPGQEWQNHPYAQGAPVSSSSHLARAETGVKAQQTAVLDTPPKFVGGNTGEERVLEDNEAWHGSNNGKPSGEQNSASSPIVSHYNNQILPTSNGESFQHQVPPVQAYQSSTMFSAKTAPNSMPMQLVSPTEGNNGISPPSAPRLNTTIGAPPRLQVQPLEDGGPRFVVPGQSHMVVPHAAPNGAPPGALGHSAANMNGSAVSQSPGSPMEVDLKVGARQVSLPEPSDAGGDAGAARARDSAQPNVEKKTSSRYWTGDEHERFLEGLSLFGPKDIKGIAKHVGTRNATQVRTHAQKYYLRLSREASRSTQQAQRVGAGAVAPSDEGAIPDGKHAPMDPPMSSPRGVAGSSELPPCAVHVQMASPKGAPVQQSAGAFVNSWGGGTSTAPVLPRHVIAQPQASSTTPNIQHSRSTAAASTPVSSPETPNRGINGRSTPRAKRGASLSKKARKSKSSTSIGVAGDALLEGDHNLASDGGIAPNTGLAAARGSASAVGLVDAESSQVVSGSRSVRSHSSDAMEHEDSLVGGLGTALNARMEVVQSEMEGSAYPEEEQDVVYRAGHREPAWEHPVRELGSEMEDTIPESRFSYGNLEMLEVDLEDAQNVALSIPDHQPSHEWP